MNESSGRLGPAMTTFVVIDAILVVTFLILVIMLKPYAAGGGSPATGSSSIAAEETPETTAPTEEETAVAELATFQLPSGNIWCEMTTTSATCTILRYTYTPPEAPDGCDGTVGNVLQVTADAAASMVCVVGDPASVPANAPVLDYGEASTVGQMTCHSSENGVTCLHNATGNGFSVARAGYVLF